MNENAIKRDLGQFPGSTSKTVSIRLGLPEYLVKRILDRLCYSQQVVSTPQGDYTVYRLSGHGQTE